MPNDRACSPSRKGYRLLLRCLRLTCPNLYVSFTLGISLVSPDVLDSQEDKIYICCATSASNKITVLYHLPIVQSINDEEYHCRVSFITQRVATRKHPFIRTPRTYHLHIYQQRDGKISRHDVSTTTTVLIMDSYCSQKYLVALQPLSSTQL
jgi:hypothetical protein